MRMVEISMFYAKIEVIFLIKRRWSMNSSIFLDIAKKQDDELLIEE